MIQRDKSAVHLGRVPMAVTEEGRGLLVVVRDSSTRLVRVWRPHKTVTETMSDIANEVVRAATDTQVSIHQVPPTEAEAIRSALAEKYSSGRRRWPLWDAAANEVLVFSYQNDLAWLRIGDFVGLKSALLLFNPRDGVEVFEIENGPGIVRVLEDGGALSFT